MMHWPRVKTIFIILFLFVDIFLIFCQVATNVDNDRIDREVIKNTVNLLEKHGISVPEDIIPDSYEHLGTVELESSWIDFSEIADIIILSHSTDESGAYVSDSAKLTFTETGFVCEGELNISDFSDNAQIKASLESMNIFVDDNFICQTDTGAFARQSIDGVPIFETGVSLTAGRAEGYWILSSVENGVVKRSASRLLPATSILTELISNPALTPGTAVNKIEIGYTLGRRSADMQHKLVSVFPAYKITATSGEYVYDAVTGELLY